MTFHWINGSTWESIPNFHSVSEVVSNLSFLDSLQLAYRLLYNKNWDESLQEYAVRLIYKIREKYSKEWNESWKYDAFLGKACDVTLKYDERYLAYKDALNKVTPPPPELLIALASCVVAPGKPLITRHQAIAYLQQALEHNLYIDGVELLSRIYEDKAHFEDQKCYEQAKHWQHMSMELKKAGQKCTPSIEPDFLVEEWVRDAEKRSI